MSDQRGRIRKFISSVVTDDDLDLYILAAVALSFTVIGATGLSDIKVLSSVLLGLLALLALSQIKSRKLTREIRGAYDEGIRTVMKKEFPADLIPRRVAAADILLVGLTMNRTVQGMRTDLSAVLKNGGRMRVAVLDPTDELLMTLANRHRSHPLGPNQLRQRVLLTLNDLTDARERYGGRLEIRVLSTIPSVGLNCIDTTKSNGLVCVQHYEFHPEGEAAPILVLRPEVEPWYRHFAAEAERLWQAAADWPLSSDARVRRIVGSGFREDFGDDMTIALAAARTSLITGVARNTFLTSNFTKIEALLRAGQRMRVLLLDPDSPATTIAADRYYASRSGDMIRERIHGSLRLLTALKKVSQGDLSVRLTGHPLAMGIIAINPTEQGAILFAEYYAYQEPGEPKFTMRPENSYAYETILGEAETLWANSRPVLMD